MTPPLEIVSRKKHINVRTAPGWIQSKKTCPECQAVLIGLQSRQCTKCRYLKAVIKARANSQFQVFDGIPCRSIPLTKGYAAWVDAEIFDDVSRWKWTANVTSRGVRAFRNLTRAELRSASGTQVKMHRYIAGEPKGMLVDHRDGDGLHNWMANLRVASDAENTWNAKNKTKGTNLPRGVCYDRKSGKYQAQIRLKGKRKSIGYFSTPEEAGEAYRQKALELHGEFAFQNRKE